MSIGIEGRVAATAVPVEASASAPRPPGETASDDRFAKALHSLGREIDRGEGVLKQALGAAHGGLGAADLIALQAGIYRYSEAVDLAAKLVDRASSAVKTTLQGQGG